SSGSKSNSEEPSSTRPSCFTLPAANSRASASDVLPTLPCPSIATFRIFPTSSIGMDSVPRISVIPLVQDTKPVQRQELVHLLDGLRLRSGQLAQSTRRETCGERTRAHTARRHAGLVLDALDQSVDHCDVAVDDSRLDCVDRVPSD